MDVIAEPVERLGVINVSWIAPTVPSGELPIIGYRIKLHVVNSKKAMFRDVTTTSAEITGLLPNTQYRVYVASLNELFINDLPYCCNYDEEEVFVKTIDGKFLSSTHFMCIT